MLISDLDYHIQKNGVVTGRYRVKKSYLGKVVMSNVGVIVLRDNTPQNKLKALYDNGHTEKIEKQ